MLDLDRRCGPLQRRRGVARRLGGISRARRQRERAEAGEQVGDRLRTGDRLAHRLDQRRFAVRRRLQEGAEAGRSPGMPDKVIVAGCGSNRVSGPSPWSTLEPREAVRHRERRSAASIAASPSATTPLRSTSAPWSTSVSWTSAVRFGVQQAREQLPQRLHQREQLGPEDMAFAHVDDLVRLLGVEPEHRPLPHLHRPQRRPAPAVRRRQMRRRGSRFRARAAPARLRPATRDSRDRPRRRHAGAGIRRIPGNGGTAAS